MNPKTRQLTTMAMLAAVSYLLTLFSFPIMPAAGFLSYDPKDIAIAIGGFIYGPFPAFIISITVCFIDFLFHSTTGAIGFLMNVLATAAFSCTAALIYKKHQTLRGALIGLASGVLALTGIMLLWNYFVTPSYMGVPREIVAGMMVPVFLPFNLIKGGLNAAITMLLYKPVVSALRRTRLVPASSGQARQNKKVDAFVIVVSLVLLASLVLLVLILLGKI